MACASRSARGIIPARVGFTVGILYASIWRRDHPRSRGVYRKSTVSGRPCQGSSPLARGLPAGGALAGGSLRIIPARAGFTPSQSTPPQPGEDHPRSRGVYSAVDDSPGIHAGSSPLARGLRSPRCEQSPRGGIIPARAGFTRFSASSGVGLKDHPRSRGVYLVRQHAITLSEGSSPLARGLPTLQYGALARDGIIPARAGFTSCQVCPAS